MELNKVMNSPFKFLDSFTKEDKDIYFGRERETEELYQRIFESKILLVYGISGTGKSSLIHCGLANKFNDSDWLPVNIRRVANINDSLKKVVIQHQITKLPENKKISKHLQSLYLDHFKPIYLIFDQFEELFIFGSKVEREEFISTVKEINEGDINARFIFVIREEYLATITEFEKQIRGILNNRLRIEKMTPLNAISCIEGPCKVAGIQIEAGFAENLLEKLSPNAAEVELTYLQVYLDKIYRTAQSGKKEEGIIFSNAILERLGNVGDLLGSFLEEQIAELKDPDTGLTILKSFVSTRGTKRQITEVEVQEYSKTLGKNIPQEQIKELIQKFVALRILREKDDNARYELRHDALAAKIYEKITLVEKDLLEIRQFIENAYSNYEKRNILLSEQDLKYIAPYEDKLFLNERLQSLIDRSRNELLRKKRRKKLLLISATILVLLAAILFVYNSHVKQKEAEREARISKSNELGNRALLLAESDPTLSFLLAEQAYNLNSTGVAAQSAIFKSFKNGPFYKEIITANEFYISPSGKSILTLKTKNENELALYNYKGEFLNSFKGKAALIRDPFFSKEEDKVIAAFRNDEIYIWDLKGNEIAVIKNLEKLFLVEKIKNSNSFVALGKKEFRVIDYFGNSLFKHVFDHLPFKYRYTKKYFLKMNENLEVEVWDIHENKLKSKIKLPVKPNSIAISELNNAIYFSENDIWKWDLLTGKIEKITRDGRFRRITIEENKIIDEIEDDWFVESTFIRDLNGNEIIKTNGFLFRYNNLIELLKDSIVLTETLDFSDALSERRSYNLHHLKKGLIKSGNGTIDAVSLKNKTFLVSTRNSNSDSQKIILIDFSGKILNEWTNKGKFSLFSLNENFIIIKNDANYLNYYDLEGNFIEKVKGVEDNTWLEIKVLYDGYFIETSSEKMAGVIRREKTRAIQNIKINGSIKTLLLDQEKKYIGVTTNDSIQIFDLAGINYFSNKSFGGYIYKIILSPSKKYLGILSYDYGKQSIGVRIIDLKQRKQILEYIILGTNFFSIDVAFLEDNLNFLAICEKNKILTLSKEGKIQKSVQKKPMKTFSDLNDINFFAGWTREEDNKWKIYMYNFRNQDSIFISEPENFSEGISYPLRVSIITKEIFIAKGDSLIILDFEGKIKKAIKTDSHTSNVKDIGSEMLLTLQWGRYKFFDSKGKETGEGRTPPSVIQIFEKNGEMLHSFSEIAIIDYVAASPLMNCLLVFQGGKAELRTLAGEKLLDMGLETQFTKNGKYIIYREDEKSREIKFFPATPEEIIRLVREEKIWGDVRKLSTEEKIKLGLN